MFVLSTLVFLLALTDGSIPAAAKDASSTADVGAKTGRAVQRGLPPYEIFRPYGATILQEGYFFTGPAALPWGVRPEEHIPDADVTFGSLEFNSLGIARTYATGLTAPYGPIDVAWLIYSGTYKGKDGPRTQGYHAGITTQVWVSDPTFCNASIHSNAPLALPCETAVFRWEPTAFGKKDVKLFSPKDLVNPVLAINGIWEVPYAAFFLPPTDLVFPHLSAFRLLLMQGITPITDGYKDNGFPNIVKHVVFDVDFSGFMAVSTFDSITGPVAAGIKGWIPPIGIKMTNNTWFRVGFPYISPDQQSY